MQHLTQHIHKERVRSSFSSSIFLNIEQKIIFLLSPLSYKPNTYNFAHGDIFNGQSHILAD